MSLCFNIKTYAKATVVHRFLLYDYLYIISQLLTLQYHSNCCLL